MLVIGRHRCSSSPNAAFLIIRQSVLPKIRAAYPPLLEILPIELCSHYIAIVGRTGFFLHNIQPRRDTRTASVPAAGNQDIVPNSDSDVRLNLLRFAGYNFLRLDSLSQPQFRVPSGRCDSYVVRGP
jgi:hypothetical protein